MVAVVRLLSLLLTLGLPGLVAIPAPPATPVESDALAKQLNAIIDGADYKHASWGILVVNAKTGATVFERNPDINKMSDLFTVDLITRYVQGKIAAA